MFFKFAQTIQQIKFRTLATIIGVALGTASLTAGFNFSETAQKELMKEINGFQTDLITWRNISYRPAQDQPSFGKTPTPLTSLDAEKLKAAIFEFSGCTPVQRFVFRVESGSQILPLYSMAAGFTDTLHLRLIYGRDIAPLEIFRRKHVCVVGYKTAVSLYENPKNALGKTLKILSHDMMIIGVMGENNSSNLIDTENGVFIPFTCFTDLTSLPDMPVMIVCRVNNLKKAESALEKANQILNRSHGANRFSGFLQRKIIEKQKIMIDTIGWLIKTISMLTLLVACIGCSNIMIVAANERVREIGLRMALGASKIKIMTMFLAEGIFLIFSGGITGIIGGYFLTLKLLAPLPQLISGYHHWEFRFYGESILKSLTVLFITAVLSSLVPAWRAASKEPSQALRDN